MNREELITKVAAYFTATRGGFATTRADVQNARAVVEGVLSAVADDLLRIAADDNRVGIYAEAHGVSRAAGHLRSLIEEGQDQ